MNDKVETAEECRAICQQHGQCVGWTWNSLNGACFSKEKMKNRKDKNGFVSGLRTCGGIEHLFRFKTNHFI